MFFYEFFLDPFLSFEFMRRSLIACLALSLGCGPVGTLLVLRRMSLIGDALSHAVLPGAAIGFMIAGLSLVSMSIGGFIAGILVALLSGFIARLTQQREDASFAAFYLISLATGVLIISMFGSNVDIMHVLFGTILAIDNESLFLVVSITSLTLLTFAIVGRGLVIESFDPGFLKVVNGPGATLHLIFLTLVVLKSSCWISSIRYTNGRWTYDAPSCSCKILGSKPFKTINSQHIFCFYFGLFRTVNFLSF